MRSCDANTSDILISHLRIITSHDPHPDLHVNLCSSHSNPVRMRMVMLHLPECVHTPHCRLRALTQQQFILTGESANQRLSSAPSRARHRNLSNQELRRDASERASPRCQSVSAATRCGTGARAEGERRNGRFCRESQQLLMSEDLI
ncbi:hypothetical protein F2P79_022836 [Pimephales promelas]|nr:hypothetical protein F2P79_022836 [Pimephales promelas]